MTNKIQPPTVLIVNDEPDVLRLLSMLLKKDGYEVVAVSDGRQALTLAPTLQPDLIVTDVVMPGLSGLELCQRLKLDQRTAGLPVMLVSALRKEEQDTVVGLKTGADDYLELPNQLSQLGIKAARLTERGRITRHYRDLVEQATDIIYTCDAVGHITSVNTAGARFFNRPASELLGQSIYKLLGLSSIEQVDDAGTGDEEAPLRFVYRVQQGSGDVYLEALNTLVRDAAGQVAGVRGILRDVTQQKAAEIALRESEERYRLLFESMPHPLWAYDVETLSFLSVNDAAVRCYGYTREEFARLTIKDLRPASDVPALLEALAARQTCNLPATGPWRHRKKDGTIFYVDITARDISYAGKRAVLVSAQDITERLQAEQERERLLRERSALLESAAEGIFGLNPEGRCIFINRTGAELLGYEPEELVNKRLHALIHYRRADGSAYPGAECPAAISQKTGQTVWRGDEIFWRRDGSSFPIQFASAPIVVDGRSQGTVVTFIDETERRQAEEERGRLYKHIQNSALEWRLTFNAIDFPVLLLDSAGRITRLNEAARQLAGKDYQELTSRPLEALPGEPWQKAAELVRDVIRRRTGASIRLRDEATGRTWDVSAN